MRQETLENSRSGSSVRGVPCTAMVSRPALAGWAETPGATASAAAPPARKARRLGRTIMAVPRDGLQCGAIDSRLMVLPGGLDQWVLGSCETPVTRVGQGGLSGAAEGGARNP